LLGWECDVVLSVEIPVVLVDIPALIVEILDSRGIERFDYRN
jgi:hypothetical protein